MKRSACKIATIATALCVLCFALGALRASGQQPTSLGPLDAKGPITYFVADGSGQAGYRSTDQELARWALEAWQRSDAKSLRFAPATESDARIRLYWAEPNGGEYGETQPFIAGGRRGAAVFIRPDVEALGPEIAQRAREDVLLRDSIVYLTCLHELGHALGLEHTQDFRDIMYFFGYGGDIAQYFGRYRAQLHARKDIAAVSGLSDSDVRRIRAIYQ